jgi:cytochrome c
MIDKPFILSKGLPGNLVADNLDGIITNVFIGFFLSLLQYKQRQNCTLKNISNFLFIVLYVQKIFYKMDSFEINKIVAAVLMVALLVIGIGKLSDVIFHVEKPQTPGYTVEVDQISTTSSQMESASNEEKVDIAALMAMGDLGTGEKVFKKCAACHSIVKGGKNNIGPALYNVVGRKVGVVSDYKYSKALTEYGKEWTFEELNGYLVKPAKWIKGTKMAFAGLRKEKDRASVILYLNQNSDNPVPLP